MPTGLRLPVGVNRRGGTATLTADEQARKIVRLVLGDADSDNAFQQNIGLGSRVVFAVSSPSFRATVIERLKEIFAELERLRLYKLDTTSINWTREAEGELTLRLTYYNLESDEPSEFAKTYKAGR